LTARPVQAARAAAASRRARCVVRRAARHHFRAARRCQDVADDRHHPRAPRAGHGRRAGTCVRRRRPRAPRPLRRPHVRGVQGAASVRRGRVRGPAQRHPPPVRVHGPSAPGAVRRRVEEQAGGAARRPRRRPCADHQGLAVGGAGRAADGARERRRVSLGVRRRRGGNRRRGEAGRLEDASRRAGLQSSPHAAALVLRRRVRQAAVERPRASSARPPRRRGAAAGRRGEQIEGRTTRVAHCAPAKSAGPVQAGAASSGGAPVRRRAVRRAGQAVVSARRDGERRQGDGGRRWPVPVARVVLRLGRDDRGADRGDAGGGILCVPPPFFFIYPWSGERDCEGQAPL